MIEVEVKIKINNPGEIVSGLERLNFRFLKSVKESDVYFNAPDRDFRETDEALRIRTVEENGVVRSLMTYKGPKLDLVSMAREEIETEIKDGEKIRKILLSLGYDPRPAVVKTRRYYKNDKMSVCVDNVEGLGDFVEIEQMAENPEEHKEALADIEKMLASFGCRMSDTIRHSYLSMLEEKQK